MPSRTSPGDRPVVDPRRPEFPPTSRRDWLKLALFLGGSARLGAMSFASLPATPSGSSPPEPALFGISLAEWSLHRTLRSGKLDHLDFPKSALRDYGIDAVEYVNTLFKEKAKASYVAELKNRCDDLGVASILIMCDGEGALGDANEAKRKTAVDNHRQWLDAAKTLGCHSIRVNAQSSGSYAEQRDRAADGLRRLCETAAPYGLSVIVENHGGWSSHGAWLAEVMKAVGHERIGTLPDFGNFALGDGTQYDRYRGVQELMPFAKGVSAKSHVFDDQGAEAAMDYRRLLRLVIDAGYTGRIGIEYEGSAHSEADGIKLTKALLEKVRGELAADRAASRAASRPK